MDARSLPKSPPIPVAFGACVDVRERTAQSCAAHRAMIGKSINRRATAKRPEQKHGISIPIALNGFKAFRSFKNRSIYSRCERLRSCHSLPVSMRRARLAQPLSRRLVGIRIGSFEQGEIRPDNSGKGGIKTKNPAHSQWSASARAGLGTAMCQRNFARSGSRCARPHITNGTSYFACSSCGTRLASASGFSTIW
jgi:hypothetical protein